jgi:hypothetical protein
MPFPSPTMLRGVIVHSYELRIDIANDSDGRPRNEIKNCRLHNLNTSEHQRTGEV